MKLLAAAELRSRIRSVSAITVGSFAFLFALTGTYQPLGGVTMSSRFFAGEPPRFVAALSGSDSVDLFSPHGYAGLGFNHPLFLVLTLSMALAMGTRAVAGDVESGRAELVYARPVERRKILATHIAIWLTVQVVVIAAAVAGAIAGAHLSLDMRNAGVGWGLAWVGVQYLGVAAVFAGVAFAASAFTSTRGAALGFAVGFATLAYLVNFVALIWEPLEPLRWLTPFGYYSPLDVARDGLAFGRLVVLLGAAAILFVSAEVALDHRDLV